jgi:hypothetical protein
MNGEAFSDLSLTAADLLRRVVAARDLERLPCTPPAWLWQGYLGPGKITLLTSQWKSGKTTMVSLLLARMQEGGQLTALPVAAGKALVISEESPADWRPRCQNLGIRGNVDLLCRPFTAQPTMDQWLALIQTAAALHQRLGTELVVIDSLGYFLPAHSENSAGALFECLTPLQRLAAAGMAVLLLHHPRKGKTVAGQAARGSGALPSFVDIIMEMGYYSQPDDLDRRRRLLAFSRYDQTQRHLLIELQPGGADYVVLHSGLEAALGDSWPAILLALNQATIKLTRQEILDSWSPDYPKPESSTLWRWLSRAVAQGLIRQDGTGRPQNPFRYWLPERDLFMRPDGAGMEAMKAWNDRCLTELVARLEQKSASDTGSSNPAPSQSPPDHAPVTGNADSTAAPAARPPDAVAQPPAPAAPPVPPLPTAAPAAATPDTPQSLPAKPNAPERPVRLPYPFNIMNPADVPEEVWKRARAGQENNS